MLRRLALAALTLALAAPAAAAPRLPDLRQEIPTSLVVTTARVAGVRHVRLGFASAVANVGAAPLVVVGHRRGATMRAEQLLAGGAVVRRVGVLRYVRARGHQHWHLLPFEVYELRRASDGRLVAGGRKTGFCLGDRYAVRDAAGPGKAAFPSRCGLNAPGLERLREGITPGWGDVYPPTLEGQFFDVTGLPAGDYDLVHRVNAGRLLRESDYANDAASIRIRLTWTRGSAGPLAVEILAACPGRDRC